MPHTVLRQLWPWLLAPLLLLGGCAQRGGTPGGPPPAVVERLELHKRQPAWGGQRFGEVGAYELVVATAHVKVDPAHPANQAIADLALAAGPDGAVRYRSNVLLLRPRDAARASGVWVFDVANRGRKLMLQLVNDGALQADTAAQAGNAWLMRQGHTLVWVGWQGDMPLDPTGNTVGMALPVATQGGAPVTGPSLEEVVFDNADAQGVIPLSYPAASTDPARAHLTVQARPDAPANVLPTSAWRFKDASTVELQRPAGFDAGAIYQFSYQARDPRPMGLGMAAVRDVLGFLKTATTDAAGQPQPLADLRPRVTVALGISQSGRFLRDFIWQGFNAAPGGGRVFDGALPTIAGSRKTFTNVRWAQPGRYSRQHEDHTYFGDQFPFTYASSTDALTGRTDGLYTRCQASRSCPKLMHLDSSLEFWQARSSLVATDTAGRDLAPPEDVRLYLMASTQHVSAATPAAGICQVPNNPARQAATYRALMARLVAWARDGTAPPASRFPGVQAGTLVAPQAAAMGWPDLAALGLALPAAPNVLAVVDHAQHPPRADATRRYPVLVPKVDADGHDLAGIRGPDVAVPLATHTGFNQRKAGFAPGQLCGLNGAYLPLATTAAERAARRDPRPAVAERHASRAAYLQRVRAAAEALRADGLMLDEDVARTLEAAAQDPRVQALP